MTTTEMLMIFFGALGGGSAVASAVYAIMRRIGKWKREMEPISPIPASEGKLCTSDRVGIMRGLMVVFISLLCGAFAFLILFFVKVDMVFLLAGLLCSMLSLLVTTVWVLMRRKYGDSIRYTDVAFTVTCLRIESRRQTHPWNHLRGITVLDDTHIRLDFKNGNEIVLAFLTDTADLIQTARSQISA